MAPVVFSGSGIGNSDLELWITDGTATGTHLVKNLNAFSGSSSPHGSTAFGNKVLFFAESPTHTVELWITDGTDAGTLPLGDATGAGGTSAARIS